jgi:hypothetical protein
MTRDDISLLPSKYCAFCAPVIDALTEKGAKT